MKRLLVTSFAAFAGGFAAAHLVSAVRVRRFESLAPDEVELPGERFYVRGRGIHLTIEGSGPPLLLIHGFGACHVTFRELVPRLRDSFTLITPDLLGHGFSDRDKESASLDAQAQLMLELLQRMEIPRAAVLGHSMGAAVALRMAAMAPERVVALMLAGGPGVTDHLAPRYVRPLAPVVMPWLVETQRGLRFVSRGAMARESVIDDNAIAAYLQTARIRGHARGLSRALTARQSVRPSLEQIGVPTLVLTGEYDGYLKPKRAHAMAEALPRGRATIIPRSAHLMLEEQPDASAAAIRAFLESLLPERDVEAAMPLTEVR
jgi:magnesium chelatase accessory protein